MPFNKLRASLTFFSVDFILCCGIFTVIVGYDFVLTRDRRKLNSNSANLTSRVGACVRVRACVYR